MECDRVMQNFIDGIYAYTQDISGFRWLPFIDLEAEKMWRPKIYNLSTWDSKPD